LGALTTDKHRRVSEKYSRRVIWWGQHSYSEATSLTLTVTIIDIVDTVMDSRVCDVKIQVCQGRNDSTAESTFVFYIRKHCSMPVHTVCQHVLHLCWPG